MTTGNGDGCGVGGPARVGDERTDPPRTLAEIEQSAAARLPADIHDFVAGGSGDERTLTANRTALDRVTLYPRMLTGAGTPDPAGKFLGVRSALPVAVAPMAYQRLVHPHGELALVSAARSAGVPYTVSTLSSCPVEEIARVGADLWFQLYWLRDRGVLLELVRRAEDAGCRALMVTVDVPVMARRPRDLHHGFALPAGVTAAHLSPQERGPASVRRPHASAVAAHTGAVIDGTIGWREIAWLRARTALPLVLKGVLHPDDARTAAAEGVRAVVVSNHGGRQLDGAPASIDALPPVVDALADEGSGCEAWLDSGIRTGTDVLRALASGASGVLVGRPLLWGLAADGEAGAALVLDLLRAEFVEALTLTGCPDAAAAGRLRTGGNGEEGDAMQSSAAPKDVKTSAAPNDTGAGPGPDPDHPRTPLEPSTDPRTPFELSTDTLHPSLTDPVLSSMNLLNEVAHRFPDAISFAPGRPCEDFFAVEDIHRHLRTFCRYLTEERGLTTAQMDRTLCQYGPTNGIIQELVARNLAADEGMDVDPATVVMTVGFQEALFLVLRALRTDERDVLLAVEPAYVGLTGAARLLDLPVRPVAGAAATGVDLDDLVAQVRRARAAGLRPRACYLVPDFANPSGAGIGLADRHRLLALADEHDILLLEDNPYGLFHGHRERLPTLKALDRARRVIYLGSFAKTVLPGARVGYAVADQPVRDPATGRTAPLAAHLSKIKSMLTVNTSPIAQAVVGGKLIEHGFDLADANARARERYARNLDQVLDGLARRFRSSAGAPHTAGIEWNTPTGGFFVVLTVPFTVDDDLLEHSARRYGVLWTPMCHFYSGAGGDRQLRLSVSLVTEDEIEEGLDRLAALVAERCSRPGDRPAARSTR
ncbi:aminotransferase class I/II-fold pyridoxal phosphate-dependent enzyme [Streptomyces silvensis]|uniref:aminotransferase class I/II-fold pyridoxal phosphate-dependent enzyme n=1 Tax=Streptomyces silvensis TaxID=1765722 RepID=UPI000B035D2F